MKTTQTLKSEMYEVILPLGGEPGDGDGPGDDGLFDDCPMCRELRAELEAGRLEEVPIQVEVGPDDDFPPETAVF